ncbi:MAG: iron ABC transporter permease [Chloroflexi bacterium]|nr:iron ABC transporter permease [Chloroflexota bacterium]
MLRAPAVIGATKRVAGIRGPLWLWVVALIIAALFAVPVGYLVVRNITEGSATLDVLFSREIAAPLVNTLVLAVTVSAATAAVGTLLAWLTMRTDLPLRGAWRVICPLPLVLPSFVAGAALLAAISPGGLAEEVLNPLGFGVPARIEGFWGSFAVLTAVSYPYVYLPAAARIGGLPPSLEEASRMLGEGGLGTFRRIVWPQVRSAVQAGTLLVFLYVVSEFGVVKLMGYETLSTNVFVNRLYNAPLAFALGLILAVVALAVAGLERTSASRSLVQLAPGGMRGRRVSLGPWKAPATLAAVIAVGSGLVAPVVVLAWWGFRGLVGEGSGFDRTSVDVSALGGPVLNTVIAAVATAAVAVVVVLPLAYLTTRYGGRAAGAVHTVVAGSFAVPGLLIALAVVFMALKVPGLGFLYLSLPLLVFAYVVHFGVQALRSAEVGVATVDRRLEEAAQTLGAGRLRRLLRIEAPLMAPALAAGGGLVLLSTMKELPATLLAAPVGFETLATRIWNAEEDGFLADMGMASVILVAVSAVLTWLLVIRNAEHLR